MSTLRTSHRSGLRAALVGAVAVLAVVAAAALAEDVQSTHPITAPPQSADGACQKCHTPDGWAPARFAHERTGFVLRDRHVGLFCADCHKNDFTVSLSTACASCHQDVHAGELGTQCQGCHTEASFASKYDAITHRKTFFPLTGRHGMIPCEECHGTRRERGFQRAALSCAGCHAKDALRASAGNVNHQRAPFSASCESCHQPTAFLPARFPQHAACFPLDGSHQAVSCGECHGALHGAQATGTCAVQPVRCADCHAHRAAKTDPLHVGVSGYEHLSARCATCHRPR